MIRADTCYDNHRRFSQPERGSFQLVVVAEGVATHFDYGASYRAEANLGIMLISLIIVLMCGACVLLNYSAAELAVKPLERMLRSIKTSAKDIFSSVAALEKAGDNEAEADDYDENMDGEVAIVERLVEKITD